MKIKITSTVGDAYQILEKTGFLVPPTDEDNVYILEVEDCISDLYHLSSVIGYKLILSGNFDDPKIEIDNGY